MLYHVIRRPPHNHQTYSSNKSPSNYNSGSIPLLMPRYHYSKLAPNSATTSSESFFPRNHFNGHSSKPIMTTTSNNNNHQYSYGPFKSTFIPLVTNSRTMTPNKREFIQIPITREDGTSITNNAIRSVPITFISETNSLPFNTNNNNNNNNNNMGNTNSKPHFTSLLRPSSKHFQQNNDEESTNIPRLPSVSRRLSFTIPVMGATTTTTTKDDDTVKQNAPSAQIHQIPIRFPQQSNVASIPTNNSRTSSAILRPSPLSTSNNYQLQRQKTDLTDLSSTDFTVTSSNLSPVRRAEVMAREAIQGIVRFQQQQAQRNTSTSDNNNHTFIRSPSLSRRVIVNLKNNQSVSLDSRLSSANSLPMKPSPPVPSSSRVTQRNNVYHIPILHEIQMPPHPATLAAETFSQSPLASNNNNNTNGSYKNEFRMEIPITIVANNDQENRIEEQDDGINDYDQQPMIITERLPSANGNSNQMLKSILKRSSSRENVSRKNVSFMNA